MINKNLVTRIDHENTDIKFMDKFLFFIIIIVIIKFKLLNNLLIPAPKVVFKPVVPSIEILEYILD